MKAFSVVCLASVMFASISPAQSTLDLKLQFQRESPLESGEFKTLTRNESWKANETAIIVCDCWDAHHCLNAVRRLEQFAPTLNKVLFAARQRGATIIHAPSDCMPAYAKHAARKRAIATPKADFQPHNVQAWCSVIPSEERSVYPIDQSDGGEDDDPVEHAKWRSELEQQGRNPNMPWKQQTALIAIDAEKDFISDQGDEVWNILQHRGIQNVILTGVHTNMCVLGRPFGLRQMARNGKHVVLMRDMTDTMYNPKSWPFVSHFEGTRRVLSHIERYVCPTVTSDQIIGGKSFRFKDDNVKSEHPKRVNSLTAHWTSVRVPHQEVAVPTGARWYRAVVMIPAAWAAQGLRIQLAGNSESQQLWCNGHQVQPAEKSSELVMDYAVTKDQIAVDDWNLIVLRLEAASLGRPPVIAAGDSKLVMRGRWQFRIGDDDYSNMPLPAKFGGSSDVAYQPEEPLWTPRPLTQVGEFTTGIEGPACDSNGNVFAVNFGEQGTIGRIRPDGVGEVFVKLPGESIGNGIRFARDGSFYVADYKQHNVLKVDPATRAVSIHAHHDAMSQPNDLAIAPDGTLYASDPNWAEGTGQLWRIDSDGTVTQLAKNMGTTNGIEVSPDGQTLYVNESKQRNVWAFEINKDGISNKRLIRKFADHGFDGMRCDIDGNLYIARYGKGTVVKMTPKGEILREIPVLGARPSNVCFGGPDRRTVYVTEVESRRLVSFRVDSPGREP